MTRPNLIGSGLPQPTGAQWACPVKKPMLEALGWPCKCPLHVSVFEVSR
jgi:hypothetical protein